MLFWDMSKRHSNSSQVLKAFTERQVALSQTVSRSIVLNLFFQWLKKWPILAKQVESTHSSTTLSEPREATAQTLRHKCSKSTFDMFQERLFFQLSKLLPVSCQHSETVFVKGIFIWFLVSYDSLVKDHGGHIVQRFLTGWMVHPRVNEIFAKVNTRRGMNEGWMKFLFLIFCIF